MGREIVAIPLEEIFIDQEFNCRGNIAPIDVIDLAKDILTRGLIQPITVMNLSDRRRDKALELCNTDNDREAVQKMKYLVIAGYRRFIAHRVNKAKTIDSIIHEDMAEDECIFFNISENVQRKNLNVLDEAHALKPLFDMGCTDAKIMDRLNVKRGWVQVRGMLLKLPDPIQQDVAAGLIGHAQIREPYTVRIREGEQSCLVKAKYIKTQKEAGKKSISLKALDKESKRQRKRGEVYACMMWLKTMFGPASRMATMLAWTNGEISDAELFERVEAFAAQDHIQYKAPEGPLE